MKCWTRRDSGSVGTEIGAYLERIKKKGRSNRNWCLREEARWESVCPNLAELTGLW